MRFLINYSIIKSHLSIYLNNTRYISTTAVPKNSLLLNSSSLASLTKNSAINDSPIKFQKRCSNTTFDDQPQTKTEKILRRFWKEVSVITNKDNEYQVALDKRPLKTPSGSPLVIPSSQKSLAILIAGEWESQKILLKQHSLPLTSLVARSIDGFEKNPTEKRDAITRLIKYFDTDTIWLVKLQRQYWDPIVNWARDYYKVKIKINNSIIGEKQHLETREKLQAVIENFDCLKLSAFERTTMLSSSFLIGLGLVERRLTVEEATKATRVETISQTMKWGEIADGVNLDPLRVS
ncbi:7065_t:CDS:2 [Diversispora eburnea]|uniref:7065_t:CDS:1 n=1 Tax=Diversispora eburnea TaxID=1213867 RepID=A0A9N8UZ00_9GLOM|nr:7065_t:CDS:2 [Diversispora eburnea]